MFLKKICRPPSRKPNNQIVIVADSCDANGCPTTRRERSQVQGPRAELRSKPSTLCTVCCRTSTTCTTGSVAVCMNSYLETVELSHCEKCYGYSCDAPVAQCKIWVFCCLATDKSPRFCRLQTDLRDGRTFRNNIWKNATDSLCFCYASLWRCGLHEQSIGA